MKVVIYVNDNNINALKVLIQSLKIAGCFLEDIIMVSDKCSEISLGYDSIFNVIKISCKTIEDLKIYKNDYPVYSETYLIVGENVEITKSTLILARESNKKMYEIFRDRVVAIVTDTIDDIVLLHQTHNLMATENSKHTLVKDNLQLSAYTSPMDIYMLEELQVLVYVESSYR